MLLPSSCLPPDQMHQRIMQITACHLALQQHPWRLLKQLLSHKQQCYPHSGQMQQNSQAWQAFIQVLKKLQQMLQQQQICRASPGYSHLSPAWNRILGNHTAGDRPWWLQPTHRLLVHSMLRSTACLDPSILNPAHPTA